MTWIAIAAATYSLLVTGAIGAVTWIGFKEMRRRAAEAHEQRE